MPSAILVGRERRDGSPHELLGALAQRAAGGAGRRVALDHAVGRVGGVGPDAGEPQCGAVDPQRVAVLGYEKGRPVGHDGVEGGRRGSVAGHDDVAPARAEDDGQLGVGGAEVAHGREVLLARGEPLEAHAEEVAGGLAGVGVAVDEPGQHEPSLEVDDPGGAAAEPPHHAGRTHGGDAAAGDGQRLRDAAGAVGGVDHAVHIDGVDRARAVLLSRAHASSAVSRRRRIVHTMRPAATTITTTATTIHTPLAPPLLELLLVRGIRLT